MATTWVYLAYPYSRGSVAAPIADLEAREAFHSLLLAYLPESYRAPTGERPAPLRLKGGVNTPAFRRALLAAGIEDLTLSALDEGGKGSAGFKQKVQLIRGGVPLPTKIEGSYREETAPGEAIAAPIPDPFIARYRLGHAPVVAAYPAPVAIWQKSLAISRRDPPQTRDIYDLEHLIACYAADGAAAGRQLTLERMTSWQLRRAAETVLAFSKQEFEGQVVAFLADTRRNDALADWDRVQTRGWTWLQTLAEARVERMGYDEIEGG